MNSSPLPRHGWESLRQVLRFGAVGVANTGVGYGIIFGCMYLLGLGPVLSNVIGYAVGMVVSYHLNRSFTFRAHAGSGSRAFMRFFAVLLLAYAANLAVLVLLIRYTGIHEAVAQVLAGVVYFAVSFLLSKFYVFAPAREQALEP